MARSRFAFFNDVFFDILTVTAYSYLVNACNFTLFMVRFLFISWGKLPEDADSKICNKMIDYREEIN